MPCWSLTERFVFVRKLRSCHSACNHLCVLTVLPFLTRMWHFDDDQQTAVQSQCVTRSFTLTAFQQLNGGQQRRSGAGPVAPVESVFLWFNVGSIFSLTSEVSTESKCGKSLSSFLPGCLMFPIKPCSSPVCVSKWECVWVCMCPFACVGDFYVWVWEYVCSCIRGVCV